MSGNLLKRADQVTAYYRKNFKKAKPEDAEDFRSYCIEQWLNGRRIETSAERLVVDFFRHSLGRKQKAGKDIVSREVYKACKRSGIDLNKFFSEDRPVERLHERLSLRITSDGVTERAVIILYFEWGLTQREISDVFGVTESRVSQIMTDAFVNQKRRLKYER